QYRLIDGAGGSYRGKETDIKLSVMTAVISTLIAVPLLTVWTISIHEKYSRLGDDMTWSAMAANGKMEKFGKLIVRGEYEKAFENVGFVGADNRYYGGEEMDGICKSFAGVLEEYFKKYTAVSFRCEGGMYGSTGIVKGTCYIGIDKSRTKGIPMALTIDYKYYEGMAYIDRIMSVADTANMNDKIDMDVYGALYNQMNKDVEIYNYPGECVTNALDRYLRGERSSDTENFNTVEDMEFKQASGEFSVKPFDEHSKEEQETWNERKAAYAEYTAERDEKINRLFSEDYRYISLTGGMAEYCTEPIFEGNIFEHFQCYRQPVTVRMETLSGEMFTVSFVMKCHFAAELPFENIVYSDNAPTEFRTGFEELFGGTE
ncbi:MAG: hypothetical protein K2K44_00160, partial [Oscillospiraceae bacterium]|nr:hypothetical protein [Oscillospiraceae bacterium]